MITNSLNVTRSIIEETRRGKRTYDVILRRFRVNIVKSGKAMGITYSEYVSVALGIQHATRMRHIICGLPRHSIFPHYLINGTIFEEKCYWPQNDVFWFSLQLLYEMFLILRRTERDMIRNVNQSSCKVPFILDRFIWNLDFLDKFWSFCWP